MALWLFAREGVKPQNMILIDAPPSVTGLCQRELGIHEVSSEIPRTKIYALFTRTKRVYESQRLSHIDCSPWGLPLRLMTLFRSTI